MLFVNSEIHTIVSKIANTLIARNQTIAISEAACGGLLSAYLVSIPGASRFFHGGTLVYSLKSKLKLSGWKEEEIASYTGPSEYSVLKQSRNLRIELGATYVLCESGYAGPTVEVETCKADNGKVGETAKSKDDGKDDNKESGDEAQKESEHKVGTVYFAISGPNGSKSKVEHTALSDRIPNMEEFARLGLQFLLEELESS